jgi:hypothetical protein
VGGCVMPRWLDLSPFLTVRVCGLFKFSQTATSIRIRRPCLKERHLVVVSTAVDPKVVHTLAREAKHPNIAPK